MIETYELLVPEPYTWADLQADLDAMVESGVIAVDGNGGYSVTAKGDAYLVASAEKSAQCS